MATTKKTTAKKTSSRSVATAKAAAKPKKSPARKPATKKTASKQQIRSFRVVKEDVPFTSFRVTRQTFYWVILAAFIIFAQLWIISLQVEVASLLDAQQAQLQEMQ